MGLVSVRGRRGKGLALEFVEQTNGNTRGVSTDSQPLFQQMDSGTNGLTVNRSGKWTHATNLWFENESAFHCCAQMGSARWLSRVQPDRGGAFTNTFEKYLFGKNLSGNTFRDFFGEFSGHFREIRAPK